MKAFFATLMAILVAALIIWLVYDVSSDLDQLAKQKAETAAVQRKIKQQEDEIKMIQDLSRRYDGP